jgi:hypothetical protein
LREPVNLAEALGSADNRVIRSPHPITRKQKPRVLGTPVVGSSGHRVIGRKNNLLRFLKGFETELLHKEQAKGTREATEKNLEEIKS